MAMAQLFSPILLVNAVCSLGEALGHRVSTTLGDSVILSARQNCRDREDFTLIHRLKDGSPKAIGVVTKGVWVPEEDYKDRVKYIPNTSVFLINATYNDNGLYEFTCDDRLTVIQLDVVVPSKVMVTEGETVKLPYYFVTGGEHNVEFIRWEKNGELVCELSLSSKRVKYGTEFEGKVSVSPDWFSRGDLSLKLERAQPEDEGDFFIYKKDKTRKKTGHPAAVRLKFKDKIACTPMTASPPQRSKGEKTTGTWTIVFITVVMVIMFGG